MDSLGSLDLLDSLDLLVGEDRLVLQLGEALRSCLHLAFGKDKLKSEAKLRLLTEKFVEASQGRLEACIVVGGHLVGDKVAPVVVVVVVVVRPSHQGPI